jgi:hypothetical protein
MLERQDDMPDLQPQTGPEAIGDKEGPDPLVGLYHMSNTAGVSTQDYVAINPTAIAALLLGLASVLIVLSNILVVIPIVGLGCGIIAIVQIRHSNQTQTGKVLAGLGILFAILFGGGKIGYDAVANYRVTGDEDQIAQATRELGKDLVAANYEHAYQQFTDAFRQRVPFSTFEQGMKSLEQVPGTGRLTSLEWNQQRMEIVKKPDTSLEDAYSMTLFNYSGVPQPRRVVIMFEKTPAPQRPSGYRWIPHDIPTLFETRKR